MLLEGAPDAEGADSAAAGAGSAPRREGFYRAFYEAAGRVK